MDLQSEENECNSRLNKIVQNNKQTDVGELVSLQLKIQQNRQWKNIVNLSGKETL